MKFLLLLMLFYSTFAHSEISKPTIEKLPNGLTVAIFQDTKLPLVDYVLMVPYGAIYDPARKSGTGELMIEMLERGSDGLTAQQFGELVESKGATSYSSLDSDSMTLGIHGLSSDQTVLFDLFLKWVLKPNWNPDEFTKQKNKMIDRWRHLDDQTSFLASHGLQRRMTSRTPYARGAMLSEVELKTVSLSDCVGFYKNYFRPNHAILIVVGNVDPKKWIADASPKLSQWTGVAQPESLQRYVNTHYEAPPEVILGIDKPGAAHADIKLAVSAPSFKSKDHFDLLVANSVFGDTFSSWLNTRVRDQSGYVYSIGSSFSHSVGFSMWNVATSTTPEQVGVVLSSIQSLYSDLQKGKLSESEVSDAKSYLIGSFAINNATVGQIASRWLAGRLFDLPEDYLSSFVDRIKAVSTPAVIESAKHQFSGKVPQVVIACDRAKCEKSLVGAGFRRLKWLKASDLK